MYDDTNENIWQQISEKYKKEVSIKQVVFQTKILELWSWS